MPDVVMQEAELRQVISDCLNLDHPKSFFLFAGAGSGKTRALVEALEVFRQKYAQRLRRSGQKVAIITYTNAACDEIMRRIDFDPVFSVSTIHSFAWELIRTHHKDIASWLRINLNREISELREKQKSGRAGTKAALEREAQINSKQRRLDHLDNVTRFTYNPDGENSGRDSLNHAEVVAISAAFMGEKSLMQQLLVQKYPVLLIDESQDTQKNLIDAFFGLQAKYPDKFGMFLFGDTMQRIYADGKVRLEEAVPDDWAKPAITINHRCPKRIIDLINKIRADADDHQQEPREDALEGVARQFLVEDEENVDRAAIESLVATKMVVAASDIKWTDTSEVKTLTLEHHMAARRGGFHGFFEPLYGISKFKTGLLNGTLSGVAFFARQVLPLIQALRLDDRFAVARIVRGLSPILSPQILKNSSSSLKDVRTAQSAAELLFSLWDDGADPLLKDVLATIVETRLFVVPDVFAPIVNRSEMRKAQASGIHEEVAETNPEVEAWEQALSAPFSQLHSYVEYISDRSTFGTHQGIKGLEFPRVMVVLDDNEARGFMFSYDKLLGAKAPTITDEKNKEAGKETSIDRTRRLLYVTCSRAKDSLAIVVYTSESRKIADYVRALGWFEDEEIVTLSGDSIPTSGG